MGLGIYLITFEILHFPIESSFKYVCVCIQFWVTMEGGTL